MRNDLQQASRNDGIDGTQLGFDGFPVTPTGGAVPECSVGISSPQPIGMVWGVCDGDEPGRIGVLLPCCVIGPEVGPIAPDDPCGRAGADSHGAHRDWWCGDGGRADNPVAGHGAADGVEPIVTGDLICPRVSGLPAGAAVSACVGACRRTDGQAVIDDRDAFGSADAAPLCPAVGADDGIAVGACQDGRGGRA